MDATQQGEAEYVYKPPTLESITQIGVRVRGETLPFMIREMQRTGFQKWGFLIYRCTYSDDAAWQRYMELTKEAIMESLEEDGRDLLLPQYLDWTVVEDREALENASKADVRAKFSEWISQRSVERDGPGADHPRAKRIARFNFCIYVDQKCLDTMSAYEEWRKAGSEGEDRFLVCVIIDENCEPDGEGEGGYPAIEGCTKYFPGWIYADAQCIPPLYDKLSLGEMTDGFKSYIRPPGIYPSWQSQMPL